MKRLGICILARLGSVEALMHRFSSLALMLGVRAWSPTCCSHSGYGTQ